MFFSKPVPKTTSRIQIAARMQEVRQMRGYPISKVAAMVDVGDNHYHQIENGKREISLDLAIVFCERFDIRADWLLFGKGEVRIEDEATGVSDNEKGAA